MPKNIQRSVKDLDWVGWNRIEDLVEKAEDRAKGLIIIGFKTGGRISEILQLREKHFSFDGEFWTVTLPLEKKYRKVEDVKKWKCLKCNRRWTKDEKEYWDEKRWWRKKECKEGGKHKIDTYKGYTTKKVNDTRDSEFPENEPLNEELKEYVQSCADLLFPHPKDPTKPMHRSYAYKLVTQVDGDIWLHWLRAQRACQLAEEAGFQIPHLKQWFKWESDKYPEFYSSRKYEMREMMSNPQRRIKGRV